MSLYIDTSFPECLDWCPQDLVITPKSWSSNNNTPGEGSNQVTYSVDTPQESPSLYQLHSTPLTPCASNDSRYQIVLEAPPAISLEVMNDPTSLTYLNKNQYYTLNITDDEKHDGDIISTFALTFHEDVHIQESEELWRFWLDQQEEPSNTKAVEIAIDRSTGIRLIEPILFDRVPFVWNGSQGATLCIKFNCLSTDFSRIKGVKGIPLSLHVNTALKNQHLLHSVFCKIKLFRDKGAERKNKDDVRHIKKHLNRLLQKEQHSLSGPSKESKSLLAYLSKQQRKYTHLCNDHVLSLDVMSPTSPTLMMIQNQPPTLTLPTPSAPLLPPPPRFTCSASACGSLPPPPSLIPSTFQSPPHYLENDGINHQHHKRRRTECDSIKYYINNNNGNNNSNNNSDVDYFSFSPVVVDRHPFSLKSKKKKIGKLCLFVKFATCTTYRAIYLEELCLTSLITNVCQKLHLDTSQINQVLWVVSDKNNLIVHVDDTVVQDIPDNQDMEINTTTNQNGTINLLLYY